MVLKNMNRLKKEGNWVIIEKNHNLEYSLGRQSTDNQFEEGLMLLDMIEPEIPEPESTGLVFIDQVPRNPSEFLALEKAKKYEADAVYFRRFEGGRASIPQIYIYNFTSKEVDQDKIGDLHRRLWNSGQVPLFFIFTRTEIKIFNCLKSPDFDPETEKVIASPLETISLAAEVDSEVEERKLKEFSARQFDNGSFWETSRYKDNFKLEDSSYETLLRHLKKIRCDIVKEKILEPAIVHKLLVMSILLKYLEERKDENKNTVFPTGFFCRFAEGANSYTGVLKKRGACRKLFEYLSRHFNGEIFKWEDEIELAVLSQTDLNPFAKFLEGQTEISGQRTLWPLYSFNDLPIELISNIYEEFLTDKPGVVYTPPYLVHFLIDEAMPLESPQEDFKVLDPACGSGVFLVAAYQRIIDWWRKRNNWERPNLETLKTLLRNNIYGVDIEGEAVRLSIFSLSLVLLDELSPKEIWQNLKFDNLKQSGNLFAKDFFELMDGDIIRERFDLIIGNPPFKKFSPPWAEQLEEKAKRNRVQVPNKQVALLFLEQSLKICKTGGLLCMIIPSGPFLYNDSSPAFRKYFFQSCRVKQILDFTALTQVLFNKKFPTAVVFAVNDVPNLKPILHVTFRRTKTAKDKIYLELDHYDLHYVSYKNALDNPLIWKTNLLGGGRLHFLISRLSRIKKLGTYLEEKKSEGWVIGEGFKIGDKSEIDLLKHYTSNIKSLSPVEMKELKRLEEKYQRAEYLTGKRTLPTEAFTENGIDESQIRILEEEYFESIREKNRLIFKGPHLLLKEIAEENSIPITFRDDDLSFMRQIVGIHAPPHQRAELLDIERKIKGEKIILFHVAAFSGRYMISRATALLKKDLINIPYPDTDSELEFSELECILMDDVLNYMLDFHRNGEESKVAQPVEEEQLTGFGEIYCKILNTVYEKFKPAKPLKTENFVCFPIYYGKEPQLKTDDVKKFEYELKKLVYKKFGKYLRINRIMRIYDENIIYLVKPNQLRFWLRSIAIRDADETFEDLVKQGY